AYHPMHVTMTAKLAAHTTSVIIRRYHGNMKTLTSFAILDAPYPTGTSSRKLQVHVNVRKRIGCLSALAGAVRAHRVSWGNCFCSRRVWSKRLLPYRER